MLLSSTNHAPRLCARTAIRSLFAFALFLLWRVTTLAAEAELRRFAVPAGDASVTLNKFAEQSGREVLYLREQVRGIRTNAVHGRFTAKGAIEHMIANTPLCLVEDRASGALMVRRQTPACPPGEHRPPPPRKARRRRQGLPKCNRHRLQPSRAPRCPS